MGLFAQLGLARGSPGAKHTWGTSVPLHGVPPSPFLYMSVYKTFLHMHFYVQKAKMMANESVASMLGTLGWFALCPCSQPGAEAG